MVWYNVFHKSFLYLSQRFQLRCILVLEEKTVRQAIILHTALSLIQFPWDLREPTPLFEKSRGLRLRCMPRWCGQPFLGWVGFEVIK